MGFSLNLDSNPEVEFEQDWTKTDGKYFIDVLFHSLDLLEKHLAVDLSALKKLAGQELTLEEAAEIAEEAGVSPEQIVRDTEEQNKAAWRTPEELAACLRSVIPRIGEHGKNLPLPQLLKKYNLDREYFVEDFFLTDLKDLLRWTEQAKKAGAKQVRISIV